MTIINSFSYFQLIILLFRFSRKVYKIGIFSLQAKTKFKKSAKSFQHKSIKRVSLPSKQGLGQGLSCESRSCSLNVLQMKWWSSLFQVKSWNLATKELKAEDFLSETRQLGITHPTDHKSDVGN